jgi:pantothenate kinase-related protein Tda10
VIISYFFLKKLIPIKINCWIGMMQSFDHGYYLLVKSIQELREKKEGLVTVGIGGPSGSGKTRLNI